MYSLRVCVFILFLLIRPTKYNWILNETSNYTNEKCEMTELLFLVVLFQSVLINIDQRKEFFKQRFKNHSIFEAKDFKYRIRMK